MNIARPFQLEFVKSLLDNSLRAIGFTQTEIVTEISDEIDVHPDSGTEVRHIRCETDFISFELYEVVMETQTETQFGVPGQVIGYQPVFYRGTPASGDNPPDVDIEEGNAQRYPTDAIREGIVHCIEERINNQCSDQFMYQDWLNEQKDKPNGP